MKIAVRWFAILTRGERTQMCPLHRKGMLATTFATRDADAFAKALAASCSVDAAALVRITTDARVAHEEMHRALECLSELALRAVIFRAMAARLTGDEFTRLHSDLCVLRPDAGRRLTAALRVLGIPRPFFWEDVVLHAHRRM